MAKIYKRTDRIVVKIDDITVKLSPLSLDQKTEIQQAMLVGSSKGNIKELTRGISLSIKYALKGMEGVVDSDGNPYTLHFENEILSDSCVEDLMNLEVTKKLYTVCSTLANGIPAKFVDEDGKPIEGVELVKPGKPEEKKP